MRVPVPPSVFIGVDPWFQFHHKRRQAREQAYLAECRPVQAQADARIGIPHSSAGDQDAFALVG